MRLWLKYMHSPGAARQLVCFRKDKSRIRFRQKQIACVAQQRGRPRPQGRCGPPTTAVLPALACELQLSLPQPAPRLAPRVHRRRQSRHCHWCLVRLQAWPRCRLLLSTARFQARSQGWLRAEANYSPAELAVAAAAVASAAARGLRLPLVPLLQEDL